MKKQLFSLILALTMLLCIGVVSASAETEVAAGNTHSISMEEMLGVTSDELFELYVDNTLYSYSWSTFSDAARENLTSQQQQLYDYAVPYIKSIATGGQASAVIALPADSLRTWGFTIDGSFTASDKDSTIAAANALLEPHLDAVRQALLLDMPFDFYWSNASGYGLGYSMSTYTDGSGTFTLKPSFHFGVDEDFRTATYDENNPTVDTAKTAATSTSIVEANEIVEKYRDASDYEKIIGYIDEICELTDYNTEAAESGSSATDNSPWQLLYVFDDDPSTEVVCEGYAKAFQYLCDLTTFDSDKVESRIVTGNMSGGTGEGPHMWNVVTMDDGNNYIVDVTNSDTGTVGQDGELKLGCAPSGSFSDHDPTPDKDDSWGTTYIISCNNGQQHMYFTYDADLPYNNDQLSLSNTAYDSSIRYNIIINATENGTVYPQDDITTAKAGDPARLIIIPDIVPGSYYALEKLVVNGVDVTAQVDMYGGTYDFEMPAKDVVVEATFARVYAITILPNGGYLPYGDADECILVTDTSGKLKKDLIDAVSANIIRDGYFISSYNTSAKDDGTGVTVDLSGTFTSDITVYVIWDEKEIKLLQNDTEVSPDDPYASITAGDELTIDCNIPDATFQWMNGEELLFTGTNYTVSADDFSEGEILTVFIWSNNGSILEKDYDLTYTIPPMEVSVSLNGEETYGEDNIYVGDVISASVTGGDGKHSFKWTNESGTELATSSSYTVDANDFSSSYEILTLTVYDGDDNVTANYSFYYVMDEYRLTVQANGKDLTEGSRVFNGDVLTVTYNDPAATVFRWTNDLDQELGTGTTYTIPASGLTDTEQIYIYAYNNEGNPLIDMTLVYLNNARPEAGKYLIYKNIEPVAGGSIDVPVSEAEEDDIITFTLTPADGYRLINVDVLDIDTNVGVPFEPVDDDTYRFTMPSANVQIYAEYTNGFLITHSDNALGYTTGSDTAQAGDTVSFYALSYYEHHDVESITVTGKSGKTYPVTGPDYRKEYSFTMPSEDVTISAIFKELESLRAFVSNYSTEKILSNGDTVQAGDNLEAHFNGPVDYYVKWVATGFSSTDSVITVPEGISEITMNLYDNDSLSGNPVATFTFNVELPSYTVAINPSMVNGTVTASKSSAQPGEEITLTITPAEGYELNYCVIEQDDSTGVTMTGNKFIMPAGNVYVNANFIPIDYAIAIDDSITGGTVTVAGGATTAHKDDILTLAITTAEGYLLDTITVMQGDTPVEMNDNYQFIMPAGNVTVTVTFVECNTIYFVMPDDWSELNVVATNADGIATSIADVQLIADGRYQVQLPTSFVTVLFRNYLTGQPTPPTEGFHHTNKEAIVDGKTYYYTHTVTLPTGTGYTAAASAGSASPVLHGGSFSFTVDLANGYQAGPNYAVTANGTPLTPVDGVYTIANITENQTVTVEGVEEIISISAITIEPVAVEVATDSTQQFTATVTGVGSFDNTVLWSVSSNTSANTTISADGLLTVAADETAASLTVTATANGDQSKTASAVVTVKLPVVPVTYTVSFDPNGGAGTMAEATGITGSYTLPECAFTAPEGKQFKGWALTADGDVITTAAMDVTGDTTLYAIWEDIPVTTPVLTSIAVTTPPARVEYYPDETFDPTGMVVTATYSDGSTATITSYTIADGAALLLDQTSVTISYTENGVTKTAQQPITVTEPGIGGGDDTTYTVTVTGGTGSGDYAEGASVTITANAPEAGKQFSGWTGLDGLTITLGSATEASVTFTMPALAVNVTANYEDIPVATFPVTVTGGTGSGDYAEGASVTITANAPEAGKQFSGWTGLDGLTITLGSATEASVTFTMPALAVNVTANYEDIPVATYPVTVTGGTGSGNYAEGTSVTITANTPEAGKQFSGWTGLDGLTITLGSAAEASVTFTMPALAVNVTANYEDIPAPTYPVTVTGGTGSGDYAEGASVTITANAPEAGKQFSGWTGLDGLTITLGSATEATVTFTMPALDVNVTANYEDIPVATYPVTVTGGSGSGNYAEGASVTITANAPEAGKQFSGWTGLDGLTITLGSATEASVTFTMPALAVNVTANYEDIPVATFQVSFDGNGASGAMTLITTPAGACQLPQCTFTAPEGKQFKAWSINGTEYAPGATITITGDTVIKAVWSDAPAAGAAPVITSPAAAQSVSGKPGDTVTLTVTATDATSYQWYINRQDGKGYVAIPGATAATYTTSAVTAANNGYTYYCVAANANGTAQSPVFTLTVEPQVPQTGDPANLALWFTLMLLSSVGILMMTVKGRKQN